jgi:hypothetical protein
MNTETKGRNIQYKKDIKPQCMKQAQKKKRNKDRKDETKQLRKNACTAAINIQHPSHSLYVSSEAQKI